MKVTLRNRNFTSLWIATVPKLPIGLITLLLLGTPLMAGIVSLQTISSKPRPTSTVAGSSAHSVRSVLC